MKVVWLAAAERNLAAILDYISAEDPGAALSVLQRVKEALENLPTMPHMGRPGRVAGTRELVVTGTPFIVPYTVNDSTVTIIRVLHGAQKWPPA